MISMKLNLIINLFRRYKYWSQPIAFIARKFIIRSSIFSNNKFEQSCLDVGSGTAPYRNLIMKSLRVQNYYEMDIAPSESTSFVSSAEKIPLSSDSMDLIVSFDVLQHIQHYDKVLNEFFRVIKPGGLVILSVPFLYSECDFHDFHRWTFEGISAELSSRGFDIVSSKKRGGIFFAIGCFALWGLDHILPGQRSGWRSNRSFWTIIRSLFSLLITFPALLLAWIGLFLDCFLPQTGFYMGVIICARKALK